MDKMKMKVAKLDTNKLYRVVAVLLVLAVGLSMLATSPYAKYATSASSTDSARVAKFSVTAAKASTQTSEELSLSTDSTTATYAFTVTNESEVVISYDVKLTVPSAMTGVTPKLVKADNTEVTGTTSDNKTYTFSNAGTLAANAGSTNAANHTIKFALDTSTAETATYTGIKLDVVATQVD